MSANPIKSEPELLKIGDFARLAGTNLRTLRYYEEIGLFRPAARSEGGFRSYRRTDVNRLQTIQALQDLGLPLDRIRTVLDTRGAELSRNEWLARVQDALRAQEELVDARLAELSARREQLEAAHRKLAECEACDHRPTADNNHCEPCELSGSALPSDLSALF
jgi:DNA-binding transcriptional MerR regulator